MSAHRIKARKRQGRCYELATGGILHDGTWTLVHGITDGVTEKARPILEAVLKSGVPQDIPRRLLRIKHAWLERGATCYEPVKDEHLPRADFYEKYHAIAKGYYSQKEVAERLLRMKTEPHLRGYWPAEDEDSAGIE